MTAAAVHWHYPHNTRHRLHIVISRLMCDGLLENTHQRTLRQVYQLSDIVAVSSVPAVSSIPAASSVPDSLRAMRRARRRVSRLIAAVTSAMVADPNPITLEEAIAAAGRAGQLCDRPSRYEMHTTVPARCNNLKFPPGSPGGSSLAHDPVACPKCASVAALLASRG